MVIKGGEHIKRRDEIVGLPVVEELSGQIVGRVKEIDYTPGNRSISGLIVERGNIKRPVYIAHDRVRIMGDNAIIIQAGGDIPAPRRVQIKPRARAYLPDGTEAGVVTDFAIDPKNGNVATLEISRGIFDDLRYGRERISHFALMEFSKDIVIWPDNWQDEERGE